MKLTLALLTALLFAPLASLRAAEPGLVAHWNFDEGRGEGASDIIGQGHDAMLKDIEWVPSPRGHALHFTSKESLARFGQADSMNLFGDVTLAVWVKTDTTFEPDKTHLIFGDAGLGVERNLNLRLDGRGGLRFEWADGKQCDSLIAPATHMNGSWKHVAVVADSQARQVAMYVDGVAVARKTMAFPISKTPVKERLTGWFYNGFFQGELDDVRLYNRVLKAEEIRQRFEAQADLQVGIPRVLLDASSCEPEGIVSATFRNWSNQPRRLELGGPATAKRE
jgi:hypothetical protein